MQNNTITNAIASNAAFDRILARLAKLAARVTDRWTQVEPAQAGDRRARLQEHHRRLRSEPAAVGSFGAVRDAIALVGMSIEETEAEALALAADAVDLVGTLPGFFAMMTRKEKEAALQHALRRPEVAARLRPSRGEPTATQYCAEILVLEIIESVAALIFALVLDLAAVVLSGATLTAPIVIIAVVEVAMFAIAVAIAALSYQDCIA